METTDYLTQAIRLATIALMVGKIESIDNIYPLELLRNFPGLHEQLTDYEKFLQALERKHGTTVVNLTAPPDIVRECALQLQQIARIVGQGLETGPLDSKTLYLLTTKPARKAGELQKLAPEARVGIIPGEHYYFALQRDRMLTPDAPPYPPSHLLTLLQRVPFGRDTKPEVHGIRRDPRTRRFKPTRYGGIEVYLPLVGGIDFFVNQQHFQPQALEQLVTVLPGDVHHHVKNVAHGPARVLILGGFGFSKGEKTSAKSFVVPGFADIPRFVSI